MNAPAPIPLPAKRSPTASSAVGKRPSAAEIDVSCRTPLLFLLTSGVTWLVVGLLLDVISSIQLNLPGFFSGTAWLTFGRLRPAAMNAILYGFASQTAIGVLLWMLCRLGGTRLLFQTTLAIATTFWNFGVTLGILGILAGASTGFTWLEMPRYAFLILFGAYAVIGICAMLMFYFRHERSLYVSQWYLLAALFWFPWIYSAANLLLVVAPVRGVVQSIIDAWFTGNFLQLWLSPVGLAAIFYFIPKLTGRPLYSQTLAAFGFWTMAVFANWTGLAQLVGGPVPAWMASTGIVANLLLVVPLISVAMNWHLTLDGFYSRAHKDLTLKFIVIAAAGYLIANVLGIILSLREVSAFTHLTHLETAQVQLAIFGFVGMTLFGSMHYIVPRVTQMEWPCSRRVNLHFLGSVGGIGLVFLGLAGGGIVQAIELHDPSVPFYNIAGGTALFLWLSTLGKLLLFIGQCTLLSSLGIMLRRQVEPLRQSTMSLIMPGQIRKEEARS